MNIKQNAVKKKKLYLNSFLSRMSTIIGTTLNPHSRKLSTEYLIVSINNFNIY